MLLALLPVAGITFLVLIVLCILISIFGNEETSYKSYFVLPFDCNTFTITSPYGFRNDPIDGVGSFHNGIDVVPTSHNIIAVASGIVVQSEVLDSGAEIITIEHKLPGAVYRTTYQHLKEDSRVVNVGDKVTQGQQIGIMGSTGRSTGPHLHFSLQKFSYTKQKFEYVDPSEIINNKINSKSYSLYDYNESRFNFVDTPNKDYLKDRLPQYNVK